MGQDINSRRSITGSLWATDEGRRPLSPSRVARSDRGPAAGPRIARPSPGDAHGKARKAMGTTIRYPAAAPRPTGYGAPLGGCNPDWRTDVVPAHACYSTFLSRVGWAGSQSQLLAANHRSMPDFPLSWERELDQSSAMADQLERWSLGGVFLRRE